MPAPHGYKPNPLFWPLGPPIILSGIVVMILGGYMLFEWFTMDQPLENGHPKALADGFSVLAWGMVIVTNGLRIWRAARTHSLKGLIGRALIIVGYRLLRRDEPPAQTDWPA